MHKLIVDYIYEEEDSVIRKVYIGNDTSALIERARANEHYDKCTRVEYDYRESTGGDQ